MNKIHKVAIVGCGALARVVHLPNVQKNPRAVLSICCDADRSAAELAARDFGGERVETDWRAVVKDPEIDLIILATHTNLRGELILEALRHGKPVYVEKPLSRFLPEMREIWDAVRATGVPVCTGHNRHSSPAIIEFERLIRRVRDGKAGGSAPSVLRLPDRERLPEEGATQILIRINDDARSWKPWGFLDGDGILLSEMTHFVDLALSWNPSPPVRLYTEGSPRGNFTLLLRFADGSITTLQHSLTGHFDYPKELFEVNCRNVSLALDHFVEIRQSGLADEPVVRQFPFVAPDGTEVSGGASAYLQAMAAEQERARKENELPRAMTVDKGHYHHLDRFLDHLENRGPNPADPACAISSTGITLKFLESAKLGLPLAVNPQDWHLPVV